MEAYRSILANSRKTHIGKETLCIHSFPLAVVERKKSSFNRILRGASDCEKIKNHLFIPHTTSSSSGLFESQSYCLDLLSRGKIAQYHRACQHDLTDVVHDDGALGVVISDFNPAGRYTIDSNLIWSQRAC